MSSSKRLMKEHRDICANTEKKVFRVTSDLDNIHLWDCLIFPSKPPYNRGAFKVIINFPTEYPFKPPKVTFKTKIYHPNIDEKGQVCLPIISPEQWKPATRVEQVLKSVESLLCAPEPEHPLRGDLAEEYTKNKQKFLKNAEDYTKKYAEKRPSDA